jgi:hypothetical protein
MGLKALSLDNANATVMPDGNGIHELSSRRHGDLGSTTPTSLRLVSMNSAKTEMLLNNHMRYFKVNLRLPRFVEMPRQDDERGNEALITLLAATRNSHP